jgi:hypothetical protein
MPPRLSTRGNSYGPNSASQVSKGSERTFPAYAQGVSDTSSDESDFDASVLGPAITVDARFCALEQR